MGGGIAGPGPGSVNLVRLLRCCVYVLLSMISMYWVVHIYVCVPWKVRGTDGVSRAFCPSLPQPWPWELLPGGGSSARCPPPHALSRFT